MKLLNFILKETNQKFIIIKRFKSIKLFTINELNAKLNNIKVFDISLSSV